MTNYAMETHGRGSADGPETDESHIASGRPSSGSNYWEAGDKSLTAGESRNHRKSGVVFLTSGITERDGVILQTTGTTGDEQVGERKWRHTSDADASFRAIIEIHFIHSIHREVGSETTGPECLSVKRVDVKDSLVCHILCWGVNDVL